VKMLPDHNEHYADPDAGKERFCFQTLVDYFSVPGDATGGEAALTPTPTHSSSTSSHSLLLHLLSLTPPPPPLTHTPTPTSSTSSHSHIHSHHSPPLNSTTPTSSHLLSPNRRPAPSAKHGSVCALLLHTVRRAESGERKGEDGAGGRGARET
jgi:hypothetical protein